jgi:hypothetical protein
MRDLRNKHIVLLILGLACVSLSSSAFPATDAGIPPDTLISIRQHPLVKGCESVLIVTDRNTYIAGEQVWYTIFLQKTENNYDRQSKAGYAEILNCLSVPVSQSRILLDENGTGTGVLPLPDTIASGDYILRGYTRSMIPFGAAHFFTTRIRVFNPYNPGKNYDRISFAGEAPVPSLNLFPEGGAVVPGTINRIVARTIGHTGSGVPAKIIFTEQGGTVIDSVFTDDTGLASINIIPSGTGSIFAEAEIESLAVRAEIPAYMHRQFSLAYYETDPDKGRIVIKSIGSSATPLYLSVISPGKISYYRQVMTVAEETSEEILYRDLGQGINEALLYDHQGNLLASRLFINDQNNLKDVTRDDIVYSVRNDTLRVRLSHKISTASVSVTISDDKPDMDLHSVAILNPWLTAIKLNDTFIQPFLAGAAKINDDLLITLNDKHININDNSSPIIYPETMGLDVNGFVTDLTTLTPAQGRIVFINLPGKECFLQYARTDTAGRFRFIVPPRRGSGEIVVYPRGTADNVIIKIFSPFSDDFIPLHRSVTILDDEADKYVLRMSVNSQVTKIFNIRSTDTLKTTEAAGNTGHFYGNTGYHLLLSDYIALPNMEEIFFELIPDIDLIKSRRGYSFRIFDPLTGAEVQDPPLMFIDGTYTTDPETIAEIPSEKAEYIDVILMRYRLGEVLLPTVISVITKQGNYRMQTLPEAALRINYLFSDTDVKFRNVTGGHTKRSPVMSNTLLWTGLLNADGDREYSFRIPDQNYDEAFRINISVSGSGQYPFSVTEIVDIKQP